MGDCWFSLVKNPGKKKLAGEKVLARHSIYRWDNVDSSSKVGIPGAEKHKPYRSEEILNVNTLHISRDLTQ